MHRSLFPCPELYLSNKLILGVLSSNVKDLTLSVIRVNLLSTLILPGQLRKVVGGMNHFMLATLLLDISSSASCFSGLCVVCVCACMCVCARAFVCVFGCMYVCVCVHVFLHMYA